MVCQSPWRLTGQKDPTHEYIIDAFEGALAVLDASLEPPSIRSALLGIGNPILICAHSCTLMPYGNTVLHWHELPCNLPVELIIPA